MSTIRKKTVQGLREGDRFEITRTFSQEDVNRFAEISRDDNPIHSCEPFIKSKNMKGPICHGLLIAGMLTEIGGQIGWLASGMDLRFRRPVYIGETIRCVFTISEISPTNRARADVIFRNDDDKIVLKAVLTGILPDDNERRILESLVRE